MGKRLRKKELLAAIANEREQLMTLVDSIPKKLFTLRGINSADWCIKDVLTHLSDWEKRTVGWSVSGLAGETPEVPGNGFNWNQTRDLNALIQKRHGRKSVDRVLGEFEAIHQETLDLLARLTNDELTTIGHFDWTGKSWTLSDYILANTANHYRWARNKIRKWLASLD